MKHKLYSLVCILPLLTSCGCDCNIGTKYYKGYTFISEKVEEDTLFPYHWFPQTTLKIHLNSNNKDYGIEWILPVYKEGYYNTGSGKNRHTVSVELDDGLNVKFTTACNVVYIPENSYILFSGECPLH